MVSEYGQAHSLRKPSEFSTVIAVIQNLDNHIQLCTLYFPSIMVEHSETTVSLWIENQDWHVSLAIPEDTIKVGECGISCICIHY